MGWFGLGQYDAHDRRATIPEAGVGRFFYLLLRDLWEYVKANLLCCLCCLPSVAAGGILLLTTRNYFLCAGAALRGGAGLVYLASVEPVVQMVLARTPECCACGCRTAAGGGIHPQDAAALRSWFAEKHAVLLAGPGLGEGAGEVCRALLGKNPGDDVTVDAPAGPVEYKILKVER